MIPTITAFERSPDGGRGLARDTRVRWALEEVGQPYDVRLVSFKAMKEPAHLAVHPFGQIPTYEEGDLAVALFIKNDELERGVWRGDLWGKRLSKYAFLAEAKRSSVEWQKLDPTGPDWLYTVQDKNAERRYRELWSIPEIFSRTGDPAPGIVTTHDKFAVSFSEKEAREKIKTFLATKSEEEARHRWKLCSTEQWDYERAKEELPKLDLDDSITRILYQPFDERRTVWDRNVAVHRRERVMRHMLKPNFALNVIRKMDIGGIWNHVLISELPIIHHAVSSKEVNFTFPLWKFEETKQDEPDKKQENLSAEFRAFLDNRYHQHYSPEEILGYLYATLYSITYRLDYAELLRGGFPRVPFPEKASDFDTLSELGWELVQAHLLKDYPDAGLAELDGKGDETVEAVRYSEVEKAVWINKTQCFKPVPEEVWNFHIGGYQVLEKYLKSRKGRQLSLDEMKHVGKVADSLAFTITQMAKIDKAYKKAFPDRG